MRKIWFSVILGAVALLGIPAISSARPMRGGGFRTFSRPMFTPGFRGGFTPGFRGRFDPRFNRGFFDRRFDRFGAPFNNRFGLRRLDRIEDRIERGMISGF